MIVPLADPPNQSSDKAGPQFGLGVSMLFLLFRLFRLLAYLNYTLQTQGDIAGVNIACQGVEHADGPTSARGGGASFLRLTPHPCLKRRRLMYSVPQETLQPLSGRVLLARRRGRRSSRTS